MSELLERFIGHENEERTAVRDDAGSTSYRTVVARARAIAGALADEGASLAGERVALLIHPSAEFVAAFFGVLLAGGCVVVLSPLHPAPETRYFCTDAGIRTVLVSAPHLALAAPLADLATVQPVETFSGAPTSFAMSDDDAALQLYTSGTTGKPKGAVLTHRNLGVQQRVLGDAWGFGAGDTLLHALPLHHMHGLCIALMTALGAGATVRMRTFDAIKLWDEMADVTTFMAVPAMYHRLFVAYDAESQEIQARWAANAKQLRLATSGSAALPTTLGERWRALTGNIPLERFGMTEIGVGLTNALTDARFPGLVGLPPDTVETRIVDDAGSDAETGELLVRGPSVFGRYHERPEETAKAFTVDGWFHTGDTVVREKDLPGAPFRILGRTSVDILKSGGYKLSALEIEEVLRDHAAVGEVAVIGIADEAWGDRVVACIVKKHDCTGTELRAFAKERLAGYKVPKDFVFLDDLPKNALGKVLKPELKRRFA